MITSDVINYEQWRDPKPFGISGCFRLRNESQFMAAAIRSFLPYLDEAVLVVQPSEDSTVKIAKRLAREHPDKVKVYLYPHVVDWIDTPGFYDKDPDTPGHLVHMSNFALSKCSYSWICKVEGDVLALPTVQKIVDRVKEDPHGIHYYGMVIINLAGKNFDKFSKENPRNGGYDEAIFNNDPDQFRFVRHLKWETINTHHKECMGWAGIHLKRCKKGKTDGWDGEHYLPLTRDNLAGALIEYNNKFPYPANDNPLGSEDLFNKRLVEKWVGIKPEYSGPVVSVIVPTYNRPELLERALASIDKQLFQDYETIVVNDAGTPVWDVVKQHKKTTLIEHKQNKGLPGSRNTGIRASKGAYITFLDDDDVIFPNHFRILVRAMENGAHLAYTSAYTWENDEKLIKRQPNGYHKELLLRGGLFPVMCAMLRRELFDLEMFDESLISHEDYDLWLRLSNHVDFTHIKAYTAAYSKRDDPDRISNKDYHINYLYKVREKHGILNLPPLPKPLQNYCNVKVLQDVVVSIDGNSVQLTKGSTKDLPEDLAGELRRAGYVCY